MVGCVDRHAGGPETVGPQAVSPSIRTREVWPRKPRSGAYTCPVALEWAPKGSLRSAHPRHHHRLSISLWPPSPSPVSGHSALDGSPGALGSGARAKAVRRWLGDVSMTRATQGLVFPLRGAPVPVPRSQAWVRVQAGPRSCGLVGCRLNSALKTSLGKDTDCFGLWMQLSVCPLAA